MYKCLFCSLCDPVLCIFSCALARNNYSRVLVAPHASPRELTTCHSRVNPTLHARICYLTCDLYCTLGMAYKDSDYTVVITETHLGGGDTSAFVSPWPPLLVRSLRLPVAVTFLAKAHEDSDHMAVIAVVH